MTNEYADRVRRLQGEMQAAGVDLVAIAPTHNMRYLLGFAPRADERLCLFLVGRERTGLVVPGLNADQVEAHTGLRAVRWSDDEGPAGALRAALAALGLGPGVVLAADDTMRAAHLLMVQDQAHPARSLPGDLLLSPLRSLKSPSEIELLAQAAAQADRALLAGVDACRPGATERDVAEAVAASFREQGADQFDFAIIGSGPNGAFPHHHPGERRLGPGDAIVVDIGGTYRGYKSDVTRTVFLGEPPPDFLSAYEAVRAANERGRQASIAGARARDVDRAARSAIEEAGYGPYFFHRTGHGLGMEDHEPPWISGVTDTVLQPGMVFSIEPGVYFPGRYGIRIEDIVAVSERGGCRCLTGLDHALLVR